MFALTEHHQGRFPYMADCRVSMSVSIFFAKYLKKLTISGEGGSLSGSQRDKVDKRTVFLLSLYRCHWGYESVNVFVPLSRLCPSCHLISLVASNTPRNSVFPSPCPLPAAFPEASYFYLVPMKSLFLWIIQCIWAMGLLCGTQGSCWMLPCLTDFAFGPCHLDREGWITSKWNAFFFYFKHEILLFCLVVQKINS